MTTDEMIQHLESVLETLRAKPVLTTPEPDPWPTAPLIVATLSSPSRSTKRLLLARNSNVVPVTAVPTAEWEAWRKEEARRVSYGYPQTAEAIFLIRATDALGLDQ